MPQKIALIDFNKCHPEKCDKGICVAALACPSKLLLQEAPYEPPMPDPTLCKGCADCVRACPAKAIEITKM